MTLTSATATRQLPRWQRSLLPSMLGADHADRGQAGASRLPRSLRDWVVDVLMLGIALAIGASGWWSDRATAGTAMQIADVGLGLGCCAALWVRRRYPLAVAIATSCIAAVSGVAGGAALLALFSATLYCRAREVAGLLGLAFLADVVTAFVYPGRHASFDAHSVYLGIFVEVAVVAVGAFVRVRRELVLSLHERNRRLQEEQSLRVAEARLAERNRIAREMHDVLAHRISLLSVHAGALEFHPDAPPEEIARAAQVIRESARAAQEELREVVGVLRAGAEEGAVQPPQPTLADVEGLVAESRAAGMEIRLEAALPVAEIPPSLGRSAYRIVQEALTNARKHAPAERVVIALRGLIGDTLEIDIVNWPRVGAADTDAGPPPIGAGSGLIGLAERAALAGGMLTHGPVPGGGFRVHASLPWPAP